MTRSWLLAACLLLSLACAPAEAAFDDELVFLAVEYQRRRVDRAQLLERVGRLGQVEGAEALTSMS